MRSNAACCAMSMWGRSSSLRSRSRLRRRAFSGFLDCCLDQAPVGGESCGEAFVGADQESPHPYWVIVDRFGDSQESSGFPDPDLVLSVFLAIFGHYESRSPSVSSSSVKNCSIMPSISLTAFCTTSRWL